MQDKIKVDLDLCNKIQKANIEMEAKRGLLAFMISSGTSLEDDNYRRYEESYIKSFEDFEKLKLNLENTFVKSNFPNAINWSLDYDTQEITINY